MSDESARSRNRLKTSGWLTDIQLAISENDETWQQINRALQGVEKRLIDIFVSLEKGRFRVEMQDLNQKLQQINTKLKQLEAIATQRDLDVQKFGQMIQAAALTVVAFGDYSDAFETFADSDDSFSNLATVMKDGETAISDFDALYRLVYVDRDTTFDQVTTKDERDRLLNQIEELKTAFKNFLADMSEQRRVAEGNELAALIDVMEARSKYASRAQARIALFDDALKTILADYVLDAGMDQGILISNLQALDEFLLEYPNKEPRFTLSEITDTCLNKKANKNCLEIERSQKAQELGLLTSNVANPRIYLPVYIIAAGHGRIVVDTHGVKVIFKGAVDVPASALSETE